MASKDNLSTHVEKALAESDHSPVPHGELENPPTLTGQDWTEDEEKRLV
jgi:hypothetical protein